MWAQRNVGIFVFLSLFRVEPLELGIPQSPLARSAASGAVWPCDWAVGLLN